jgi:hypothetical protein
VLNIFYEVARQLGMYGVVWEKRFKRVMEGDLLL